MKRKIGEIRKEVLLKRAIWKVILPEGYEVFKTRKEAEKHSEEIRKITW